MSAADSHVYQDVAGKDTEAAAELFFDLANEGTVSYRCRTTPPKLVTVRQDRDIEDCTGGIVWETAYLLATFLENRGLIDPKQKVLEVGAGCGLLGLVLANHGCRVVLTEATEAMANLRLNVEAAVPAQEKDRPVTAEARLLRWDKAEDIAAVAQSEAAPFDLILGTYHTNAIQYTQSKGAVCACCIPL